MAFLIRYDYSPDLDTDAPNHLALLTTSVIKKQAGSDPTQRPVDERPISDFYTSMTLPLHAQISIRYNTRKGLHRQSPWTFAASGIHVLATIGGSGVVQALGMSAVETAVDDLFIAVSCYCEREPANGAFARVWDDGTSSVLEGISQERIIRDPSIPPSPSLPTSLCTL